VWDWLRKRLTHDSQRHSGAQEVNLAVRKGRSVCAYVIGRREPRHDAYVVEELAYADDASRALVPPLLRAAAGDLRRIVGWLPPAPARGVLPRGSVRKRSDAIWMIASLTSGGNAFLKCALAATNADGVWSLDRI
jgi:hypothetical protein